MQEILKYIRYIATAAFAAIAMCSCVYDYLPEEPDEIPHDVTLLNIGFRLPGMRAASDGGAAGVDGYGPGVDYENYLDIKKGKYKIYFFGTDNKYLAEFIPLFLTPSGTDAEGGYEAVGMVPGEVSSLSSFKIVALANWPSCPAMTPGVTTIDDLCNAEQAQFDFGSWIDGSSLKSFELNPDRGMIIPFFGVHEYTGVTFEKGKRTVLAEPVALLRAMAKVEVVFDNDAITLSDVVLRGYNPKGYCAPAGVYSQAGYDHNGNWSEDYVKTPHLVGGVNDPGHTNAAVPLLRKYQRDDTKNQKETWVAYVPEYRNTNSAGTPNTEKSHIELRLDIQDADSAPYIIDFAEYDEQGKMKQPGTYFDICRNNYYRFNVKIAGSGLVIIVRKWENAYDNKFIFE